MNTVKDPAHALPLFHHLGLRPEAERSLGGLLPPHLAPLGASASVRGEFPVCVVEGEDEAVAQPVSALVDDALAQLSLDDDERAQCVKIIRRLEREIAEMADQGAHEALLGLWGAAATALIADPDVPESEREVIRRYVSQVHALIPVDGLVIPFHPTTPLRLLRRVADRRRQQQGLALKDEVETLAARLTALLGEDLSPARQARVAATLKTLQTPWPPAPDDAPQTADSAAAQAYVEAEMRPQLAFFRALRTARLEAEQAYDEDTHDALLAHLNASTLTTAERAGCPPILLHLDTESLDGSDFELILSLLETPQPVIVLLTVDQLHDGSTATPTLSGWRTRLAERAMASGRAFVMQTTAAEARLLMEGFTDGMRYDGSALFVVYTGAGAETPHLHPYLAAQAALSSRTFPGFVYDPSKGADDATRFRLAGNLQPEKPWAELEAPGAEGTAYPFTPAGFLACDARLDGQFMVVPAPLKHDALTPLTTCLTVSPEERDGQIPTITLADENGKKHRVVCTDAILRLAETTAVRWRSLQERGGINNSHAAKAVAAEKVRMTEAFEAQKAALAKQHEAEIEQVTEAVAQRLAANIAAGLLDLSASEFDGALPPAETAAPAAKAPPAETAAQATPKPPPAEAAETSDDLSFDEPYIDTPECTSCDECINLNAAIFAYDDDEKAYIKDPRGGPYKDLVAAAEACPARIIHPGKPLNPDEPGLAELLKRAEPYL